MSGNKGKLNMSCLNVSRLQEVTADEAASIRPPGTSFGFPDFTLKYNKKKDYNKLALLNAA